MHKKNHRAGSWLPGTSLFGEPRSSLPGSQVFIFSSPFSHPLCSGALSQLSPAASLGFSPGSSLHFYSKCSLFAHGSQGGQLGVLLLVLLVSAVSAPLPQLQPSGLTGRAHLQLQTEPLLSEWDMLPQAWVPPIVFESSRVLAQCQASEPSRPRAGKAGMRKPHTVQKEKCTD